LTPFQMMATFSPREAIDAISQCSAITLIVRG
jgi:hypothetical protein